MFVLTIASLGIEVLLGWLQYRFGKKGCSTEIGILIPVVYILFRSSTMLHLNSVRVTGVLGTTLIGYLYYHLYKKGKASIGQSS